METKPQDTVQISGAYEVTCLVVEGNVHTVIFIPHTLASSLGLSRKQTTKVSLYKYAGI